MSRLQRQAVLAALIDKEHVASHEDALRLLKRAGIRTTQATVSRDLEEIGAVRTHTIDGVRYRRAANPGELGAPLQKVIKDYVLTMQSSGNLVVLRTPAGHASMVAAAIDRSEVLGILGTIAGDDTVFICVDQSESSAVIMERLGATEPGRY